MQQALRPYATAGIAVVGASMIAISPVAAPPIGVQARSVQLVDAWSDLFATTAANWQSILNGADSSAISEVFSLLKTDPSGVIDALTNLDPTVTTELGTLPGTISVDLPPGLALAIADLGATGATLTALNSVSGELTTDPSEAIATVLNGFLNGESNISLLGGIIDIPFYNGILAPEQPVSIDLNLTALINALGLGDTSLSNLDLSSLLSQLGLGTLNLGTLFNDLGLSSSGLGTLLENGSGVSTLGGLLNLLGLDNLGSGDSITLGLTNILSDLGLDTNVNLNNLTLGAVLSDFDLNPNASVGLVGFLNDVGLSGLTSETLASLLGTTDIDSIATNLVTSLLGNGALALALSGLTGTLTTALETALTNDLNVTVGTLLGGQTLSDSLDKILAALGMDVTNATPLTSLSIGTVLQDLGFSGSTGDLTLGSLLTDLGNPFGALNITDLLNGLDLGTLLDKLDLSSLPVNLTNLGDLSGLTLDDLLGDLGLGNLATVSVEPVGGLVTELVDTVPQQILAALGM